MRLYTIRDQTLNQMNTKFLFDLKLALTTLSQIETLRPHFKRWRPMQWFFVLGHHGSGKTELIQSAEQVLHYVYHDPNQQFSFYFETKKIFVEISEKYLVGAQAALVLKQVVNIIQSHHARLSGLLITLNLYQLLTVSKTKRQAILNDIKNMMRLVQASKTMPIWFIITYLDVLNGFKEFFDDLLDIERQHSLGLAIQSVSHMQELIEVFNYEFQHLIDHIHQRLIRCLHHIRDQERRILASDFPIQFEQISGLIRSSLRHLFKQEKMISFLKGIYFVSNKQITPSIDRMVQPLSKQMILKTPFLLVKRDFSRSYFSHEFFKECIVASVAIKGFNQKKIVWITQGFISSAVLLVSLCLGYQFTQQVMQLSEMEHVIRSYPYQVKQFEQQKNFSNLFTVTESMQTMQQHARYFKKIWLWWPWLSHLSQLQQQTKAMYQKILAQQLIPSLGLVFEKILKHPDHYPPAEVYAALKGYRMLMETKHFDPIYLALWFRTYWQYSERDHMTEKSIRHQSERLYDLLQDVSQPISVVNARLVFKISNYLKQFSLPKIVFFKVKNFSDYSGYDRTTFDSSTIPAMFTKQGYETIYLPQVETVLKSFNRGDWVLGYLPDIEPQQHDYIHHQIDALYFKEYQTWWHDALRRAVSSFKVSNLKDAELLAVAYGQKQNPLSQIIRALIFNTQAFENTGSPYQIFKKNISEHFKTSHMIKVTDLADLIQSFQLLGEALHPVNKTDLSDFAAFQLTKAFFNTKHTSEVFSHLLTVTRFLPKVIANSIQTYIDFILKNLIAKTEDFINVRWQRDIWPIYQNNIFNKYPIKPHATAEITLKQFDNFFNQNGSLDRFFQSYCLPFIHTDQIRWYKKEHYHYSVSLQPDWIEQFERAYIIRKMFFNANDHRLRVQFFLKPLRFSSGISSIVMDISGQQSYDYQGSRKQTHFVWPKPNSTRQYISILLENHMGDIETIRFSGVWALLRLIDRYHLVNDGSTDRYRLHLTARFGTGDYLIVAHSKINPFINRILDRFYLKADPFRT